jgi:hypothetical protein
MRTAWVFAFVLAACDRATPPPKHTPATAEQAAEAGRRFVAAALPCDETKLGELIDHEALAARFAAHSPIKTNSATMREIRDEKRTPHIVCEWQRKASSYTFLHVHTVAGEPRPVLRRVVKSDRTGVQMVGYDELVLDASMGDSPRVVDIYSYVQGQALSELLAGEAAAIGSSVSDLSGAREIDDAINHARRLTSERRFTEALAAIDALPKAVHRSRAVQMMRLKIANNLSETAYKQAIDEIAATFPGDPTIAMVLVDGHILGKDYDAALRDVDVLDQAIGGDPWQDAIRAEILVRRDRPGDLELASTRAESAIRGEPRMSKGYFARLDVQLTSKRFPEALDTMTLLSNQFQAKWDDDKLRATPSFAELVATPEYAAWRTSHP